MSETTDTIDVSLNSDNEIAENATASATSATGETLKFQETPLDESRTQFQTRLNAYLAEHKVKVVILTPCYGGVCHVNYTCCLINTLNLFTQLKIPIRVEFCKNDSLVSRARNNLIAKGMVDKDTTHFMFIDSDITWNPVDILKLILSDRGLVGGVYPVKSIYWDAIVRDHGDKPHLIDAWLERKRGSALKGVPDEEYVQHRLVRYNINYLSPNLHIENNVMEVKHLATGFMMIQRATLEALMEKHPETKYVDDVNYLSGNENDYAYALFDCGVENGHYYSEDWLFCSRWSALGGRVYADISIDLTHTGQHDFRGSYLSTLV